jgi:hypothetical protein
MVYGDCHQERTVLGTPTVEETDLPVREEPRRKVTDPKSNTRKQPSVLLAATWLQLLLRIHGRPNQVDIGAICESVFRNTPPISQIKMDVYGLSS